MMARRGRPLTAAFHLLVLAAVLHLTTGCFVPQPIEGAPKPASEVQVRLTEAASQRISVQARRPVQAVSGTVVRSDADSLILAVRWGEIAGGSSGRPGPDVVRLAQSEIEDVQRPEFSLPRTLILAGGLMLFMAALVSGALGTGGGTPDERDPGEGKTPDTQ